MAAHAHCWLILRAYVMQRDNQGEVRQAKLASSSR